MADSTGVNAQSGLLLTDWPHVEQSIRKILGTPIGTRVMRRDFGSRLPDLVDAKMVQANVLAIYQECAVAINRWEPRFRMTNAAFTELGAGGRVTLQVLGTYYPRGHLGDFTPAENQSFSLDLAA